jgi:hypothetical protein
MVNMTVEQLRTLHHATPFRPFIIRMADGRSFRVTHPDFLSHSPTGRTLIVHHKDDSFSVLDLLLATELEVDGAAQSSGDAAA